MHPFISVIIPVYEVTLYLAEALASVLGQKAVQVEVIVVDDGSGDEAAQRISASCAVDPRIMLLTQENAGPAAARVTGLAWARGDFVMFLDADDIVLPGALMHLTAAFGRDEQTVATYGGRLCIDEAGDFLAQNVSPGPAQAVTGDILPALLRGASLLSNGNCCIRREALLRIDFPTHLRQGEDWVTWCRLALQGPIHFAGARVVLGIRQHAHNASARVVTRPAELLAMLPVVYNDPAFRARIGDAALAECNYHHRARIHRYLMVRCRQQRRFMPALRHRITARYWQRKLPRRVKVLHIVKWFYAGGAERLVSSVLQHSDHHRFEHHVLSLSDQGERLGDIQDRLGIPYRAMDFRYGAWNIRAHWRCLRHVIALRPDVIKTWLPPANITGGAIGMLTRTPVVWGGHDALPITPQRRHKRWQRALVHWLPHHIVCCSQPAWAQSARDGFPPTRLQVIANGTDTACFRRTDEGRASIRRALGIRPDALVIGMAAEYVPLKRHAYFLEAAAAFLRTHPDTEFILCGKYVDALNEALCAVLQRLGLSEKVHLLGIRDDMVAVYSALDIHTLVSSNESFGLAVTEAMACETYCVATDTGLLPTFLEGVGENIPICDDPMVLVEAWQRYLALAPEKRSSLLVQGRKRIEERYSIATTAQHYDAVYAAAARRECMAS